MKLTEFALLIKQCRTRSGLSVRALAMAVGKSPAYLAKIEVQGEVPSPGLTTQLAKALGADPRQFLDVAMRTRITATNREIEREYQSWIHSEQAAQAKGQSMTKVVSLINMKGGVGKSTLAM